MQNLRLELVKLGWEWRRQQRELGTRTCTIGYVERRRQRVVGTGVSVSGSRK